MQSRELITVLDLHRRHHDPSNGQTDAREPAVLRRICERGEQPGTFMGALQYGR